MPLELLTPPSALDRIGFELGWDFSRYGLEPAQPHASAHTPLRDGLRASRATFGSRRLGASVPVQQWLELRLSAWLRGRSVETVQVTPHYLAQLNVSHCPVTRQALAAPLVDTNDEGDAPTFSRVRNDAGYAAGNLAVMSARAHRAKGSHDHRSALALAQRSAGGPLHRLDADAWARLAVLCSFVQPLPHDEACALPLHVLPPNRLRLFNPAQALQTALSRLLLADGWSARVRRIAALLPPGSARRSLLEFFAALLPRFLEGGRGRPALEARWAIEDAWRAPLVLKRWQAFARPLGAAGCEALLLRAAQRGLVAQGVWQLADAAATDGWALATRGHVAPTEPMETTFVSARSVARRTPLRSTRAAALATTRTAQACLPLQEAGAR
ncbi:MAG: hypothetical protein ABIO45_06800 [Burkholderiaceae bacterium]